MIVACIGSDVERAAIVRAAGNMRVHFCTDVRSIAESAAGSAVVGVIVEPRGESDDQVRMLAAALAQRPLPAPLLLRFDLLGNSIRHVLGYVRQVPDLHLSLRGFDELSDFVSKVKARELERAARETIVAHIVPLVRPAVRTIVSCVAICGERRCTVSGLTTFCHMSARTIEERLAAARIMGAKQLLMRLLVLHTLWRESVLGWSSKRAANAAGFPSSDALAKRIKRAIGQRPSELLDVQSFSGALEELAADLVRKR